MCKNVHTQARIHAEPHAQASMRFLFVCLPPSVRRRNHRTNNERALREKSDEKERRAEQQIRKHADDRRLTKTIERRRRRHCPSLPRFFLCEEAAASRVS